MLAGRFQDPDDGGKGKGKQPQRNGEIAPAIVAEMGVTIPTIQTEYLHSITAEESANSGGLLADAMDVVCDIVDAVLEIPGIENSTRLEEIQVKLDLWADGLEVMTGRLERVINESNGLKKPIFMIWLAFFRYLTKNKTTEFYQSIVEDQLCRIVALTEKISYSHQITSTLQLEEEFPESGYCPIGADQLNKPLLVQVQEFIEQFREFQERLSRIAPFIMNALKDSEGVGSRDDETSYLEDEDDELNNYWKIIHEERLKSLKDLKPQDWYRNSIREKFLNIEDGISDIIARELWELYRNVKATLYQKTTPNNTVDSPIVVDDGIENAGTSRAKTVVEHDSTYESMQSLAASMIRPAPRRLGISFSDIASNFSSSSVQLKDRPQVPLPPEGVHIGQNDAFQCQFCLEMVSDIDTTGKWRKHILADIRPYFCTFTDCNESKVRYRSKKEWIAHEVNSHRLRTLWKCKFDACTEKDPIFHTEQKLLNHLIVEHNITSDFEKSAVRDLLNTSRIAELDESLSFCRICQKKLPNRASQLASHIGRHLEDFALPILSQLDDRVGGSDGSELSSCCNSSKIIGDSDPSIGEVDEAYLLVDLEKKWNSPMTPSKSNNIERRKGKGKDRISIKALTSGNLISESNRDSEMHVAELKSYTALNSISGNRTNESSGALIPKTLTKMLTTTELEEQRRRAEYEEMKVNGDAWEWLLDGIGEPEERMRFKSKTPRPVHMRHSSSSPVLKASLDSLRASTAENMLPSLPLQSSLVGTEALLYMEKESTVIGATGDKEEEKGLPPAPSKLKRYPIRLPGYPRVDLDPQRRRDDLSHIQLSKFMSTPHDGSESQLNLLNCPLNRIGHPQFPCDHGQLTPDVYGLLSTSFPRLRDLRQHIQQEHALLFSEETLNLTEYLDATTWDQLFQQLFPDWPDILPNPSLWPKRAPLRHYLGIVDRSRLDSYLQGVLGSQLQKSVDAIGLISPKIVVQDGSENIPRYVAADA
ncbi:hypothetical protein TWF506_002649 [Arthrobotrys conoides]|uniref:C2H2-type domain-containing protein n=1 Tax=Arthrobotrys conoides TaxID=74498 RepID=A0AAN8N5D2_9PEZI